MKITLPVHHFPPHYTAGAELYTFRLARWLRDHGHDAEVVTIESIDQGAPDRLDVTRDTYQGVPVWRLAFDLFNAPERATWNYDNALIGRWFADYLLREQPDLVHFQAGYLLGVAPLKAAAGAGVPTVLTLHDYWYLCPRITLQRGDGSLCEKIPTDPAGCVWCRRLEQRRYALADQWTAGLAGKAMQHIALHSERDVIADRRMELHAALALPQAVIAPSHFLAAQFAPHVAPDKLRVLRYGLDLAPFADMRRPLADGTLRIGFIGQIAPHKGVHLLVEAFKALRTRRAIELHMYGNPEAFPDYVKKLRAMIGTDQRIKLHGRTENSAIADVLGRLDVTVVPSMWYENSPLAIMEAHAANTPVITAALGGMAELVRDDVDGLHFAPSDANDLARQIQRIVDHPEILVRLRSGIVAPAGIDDEMQQITMMYDQLVEERSFGIGAASALTFAHD